MLRRIALGFALVISSASFAGPMSTLIGNKYEGSGNWKLPDAKTGTYTATSTFASVDNSTVSINTQIKISTGENKEWTVYFRFTDPKNAQFFDNLMKNEAGEFVKVGAGYCYESLCHFAVGTGTEVWEETMVFQEKSFVAMGSKYEHSKGTFKFAYLADMKEAAAGQ